MLNPLLQNPGWAGGGRPLWVEVLIKLKPLLMSIYFGADHIVWLQQVGCVKLLIAVGLCSCGVSLWGAADERRRWGGRHCLAAAGGPQLLSRQAAT